MTANQNPLENLAYILKLIQHRSLLTRPIPHSYRKYISPQSPVRNHQNTSEDTFDVSKNTCKTTIDQNQTNKVSQSHRLFIEQLMGMSDKSPREHHKTQVKIKPLIRRLDTRLVLPNQIRAAQIETHHES
jgi:hypothetical protein